MCFASIGYEMHPDGETMHVVERAGCFNTDSHLMQCKAHLIPHFHPKNITCCNAHDYCNEDRPALASTVAPRLPSKPIKISVELLVLLGVLIGGLMLALLAVILYCAKTR